MQTSPNILGRHIVLSIAVGTSLVVVAYFTLTLICIGTNLRAVTTTAGQQRLIAVANTRDSGTVCVLPVFGSRSWLPLLPGERGLIPKPDGTYEPVIVAYPQLADVLQICQHCSRSSRLTAFK